MTALRRKSRPAAETAAPAGRDRNAARDYEQLAEKASQADEPYRPFEWFKFRSSKWLASTRGLSLAEAGALATLRAMIHERGEPLSEEYGRMARQVGAPSAKAFERIVATLLDAGLLVIEAGGLWCREIEEEIDHQRGVSRAAKENRSKVGQKTQRNQRQASTGVRQYKSKNEDVEGKAVLQPSPSDNQPSLDSSSSGRDALKGASGHDPDVQLEVGQSIDHDHFGTCRIVDISPPFADTVDGREFEFKAIRLRSHRGLDLTFAAALSEGAEVPLWKTLKRYDELSPARLKQLGWKAGQPPQADQLTSKRRGDAA